MLLSLHVLFHKVANHFVQLQHSVLGTLHHLAGGAAQLALVLGKEMRKPPVGPTNLSNPPEELASTGTPTAPSAAPAAMPSSIPEELVDSCLIVKLLSVKKIRSPALLFPVNYLVSAFFMQKFVVYCSTMF